MTDVRSFTNRQYDDASQRPVDPARGEVDQWMSVLAHELRQPLSAVMLALETGPATHMSCGDLARAATAQMQRIIADVLDLCRHRNGHAPSATQVVNLAEVVIAAVNVARPTLMAKGHVLIVSMPSERILVRAHRCRLEQVLTNLLVNAAQYTDGSGRIVLTVEPVAGTVVVRVRDNGIGIPPTLLPYVFDYYRRGTARPGTGGEGLGLGLALVKRLVELHGGTVSVHSDGRGMGSEFAVQLPSDVALS